MSDYIVQRHLPGNDYGEWGRNKGFVADDDEDALVKVMEIIGGMERFETGDIRISRIIFKDQPSATGHPYPDDERNRKAEELMTAQADMVKGFEGKEGVDQVV